MLIVCVVLGAVTQADLADATGMTNVHINRTLKELKLQGFVTAKSGKVSTFGFAGGSTSVSLSSDASAVPWMEHASIVIVTVSQPCDIMLRSDGKRISEMAMLVPLIELNGDGLPVPDPNEEVGDDSNKTPELPFRLKGKKFKLNMRSMAYVRLSVLDLACLRSDGCVRVDAGQGAPAALLAGGRMIYGDRTGAADASLALPVPAIGQLGQRLPIDDRLLLTMSDVKPWDRIRLGARLGPIAPAAGNNLPPLPDRVTWFLRREGRVRAPYSAF